MPTGFYQHTTLPEVTAALAARLMDPALVRWTRAELERYVIEALQTWAALTGRYRAPGVFAAVAGQAFYDLPTVLPTLRAQTITDRDLITTIQYHLLEPATPTAWSGSDQFTLDDLVQAITRRRDQFLAETGAVVTRSTSTIAPPTEGRITLADTVTAVRRAAWTLTTGQTTPLLRDDVWSFTNYRPGWVQQVARPPRVYSVAEPPPLILQVVDPPLDTGTLDLCTINSGPALDPTVGVALGVPNDWAWVIKWGALADLLSRDGLAQDLTRAAYCEQRWQQGVSLAAAASVVWSVRVNNVVGAVRSVSDADVYKPRWQTGSGRPRGLLTLGQTLIALEPVPNLPVSGPYSVTVDVVRNIELPSLANPYLQVGQEDLDVVIDYAQHVALFKEGGAQIQNAQGLLERFLRAAGVTLTQQQAAVPNRRPLVSQQVQDTAVVPRTVPLAGGA